MQPQTSFVVPVYNGAKYLEKMITSIISQSCEDWEMILVDDCSTDNSLNIIQSFSRKDHRINFMEMPVNSGNARVPILKGIQNAKAELCIAIGQDDYVEKDYLSKMLFRKRDTDSDIVLSTMCFFREENNVFSTIPRKGFNINVVLSGKEACENTIGGWNISLNGALIPKQLWMDICDINEKSFMNLDEVDSRRILLASNKVSLCDAKYYYRKHSESITTKVSIKLFDVLETTALTDCLIANHFSLDSKVYSSAVFASWSAVKYNYLLLGDKKKMFTKQQRTDLLSRILYHYRVVQGKKKYIQNLNFIDQILLVHFDCLRIYAFCRTILKAILRK